MKQLPKPVAYALIAFLAAWQATDFSLDYRAIMGALVAAAMGFLNPVKAVTNQIEQESDSSVTE